MIDENTGCGLAGAAYPSDCEITEGLRKRAMERVGRVDRGYAWRASLPKARDIRLLLLDVDGVLTDGSVVYTDAGSEIKSFNIKDGFGIRLLREAGVEVGIITARSSEALRRRVQDLKLSHVYQGVGNKAEALQEICSSCGIPLEQIAYMGDDWLDLPVLARVGFAVTVADAVSEVREIAHYVTKAAGGRGAVRELCELIIEAKGLRAELLAGYLR